MTESIPATQTKSPTVNQAVWASTALEFVEECAAQLWQPSGAGALNWLHWRGLNDEILARFQIGYNPIQGDGNPAQWGYPEGERVYIAKGIVLPCIDRAGIHYVKIRQKTGEPKYQILRGGHMWPFGLTTFEDALTGFIFEGEFDALLACQTGLGCGFASLPAGQELKPEYAPFMGVDTLVVCMDDDEPGQNAAEKYKKYKSCHIARSLPMGKDLTEFAQLGGNVLDWLLEELANYDTRR